MNEKKEALKRKFSADYKRYYLIDLFREEGFVRRKCENCGRFFWTLDPERRRCDDQPCSTYTFIGDPPATKKFDEVSSWKAIERFFVNHRHASVKRYPVVSRWRPDLYFTVASIVDFQRVEAGKVVFQLPANPLVVPQMCMRFNDIPNVGVSGKHYTSFVMVGQHSIADKEGYWKDRCVDLDFRLMTREFGIPKKEITFNEDVWVGYGAFGYSLEFFVRGLELGNAVFTAFEGDVSDYREMKEKVVDMGTGLQRWAWLSQGTPTNYDANFSSVLRRMDELCKVDTDRKLFLEYSKLAGTMNVDEFGSLAQQREIIAKRLGVDGKALETQLGPREAMYSIADHSRTLLFAIADGMLPSNSGGGYNLRIVFRRAMNFIKRYRFPLSIADVVNWHVDHLSGMYPELEQHREDVAKVLEVEASRYAASSDRVSKLVSSLSLGGRQVSTEQLIRLYDSDGVTPEQLADAGAVVDKPEDFYEQVQARHITRRVEEPRPKFDTDRVPPTKLLYYDDSAVFDFRARVLKVFQGGYVVLNQTVFYPRGGGQEPDRGTIGEAQVVDVEKYGDVVIHRVEGKAPRAGTTVRCQVDTRRRRRITQIHTATHIINGSSRQVLGPWVWQHSAFKEEDYGRIDITHFAHLTEGEVQKIEDVANEVVRKNLKVANTFMPRQEAEEKYGFRLYQGGVVPGRLVRVVNIGGWDIEACGGTHSSTTGEVGLIKIVKVERVQDGVERLEFVAGEAAIEYMHRMDLELRELTEVLGTQRENLTKVAQGVLDELEAARAREKSLGQAIVDLSSTGIASQAKTLGRAKLYVSKNPPMGEEQIIAQGQKSVAAEPLLIYVALFSTGKSARIICFVGTEAVKAGYSASEIVKKLAPTLGGSGGGSPAFAQGGGPRLDRIDEAKSLAEKLEPLALS
ncbi:MAG: alanine--tRNA ligase [Nitrososphaerota archaeon]|nr:alanine--tRNA ligase [Nitrososphaerota archaeon]MDG7024057.1 alanine--tRNA ligase [Nitrososphaerota archaeon]